MSLVGKFFLHSGAEYYQTGEVTEQADQHHYFLKFDGNTGGPPAIKLFCIHSLSTGMEDEGFPDLEWQFFPSRQELTDYLTWLDTPSPNANPKLVKLHDLN